MNRDLALMITLLLTAFGLPGCAASPNAEPVDPGRPLAGIVKSNQGIDLEINRKATHLLVEQTLNPGQPVDAWKARSAAARRDGERLPDRLTVARLIVRYADGRQVDANIRYGESVSAGVRDWWNPVDGFIYHLAFAEVMSVRPFGDDELSRRVVYRMRWPNPRPDVEIESVAIKPTDGLGEGELSVFDVSTESTPTKGAVYFVAPNGDDDAAGDFDRPWATLGKAAATIEPGDTVYVRGGLYQPTHRIVFKYLDAPEGQRTRIIGYPGETAVFDFFNAHWDKSPQRRNRGFEFYPHDQSMIMAYDCDRFTFKNLHLIRSRARGFGIDTGWAHYGYKPEHLIGGGEPEQVNDENCVDSEILYCSVWRVFSAGIRFSKVTGGRLIGNVLMRPETISMGPAEAETAGFGPVVGMEGTRFVNRNGERKRNPPMEGIDCGKFADCEIAYNEICWGDKECCLIDGNVDGLRVHHNYVHDAWNLPWVGGIAPNGYGRQENIEIDHNIAHNVGTGFGVGTEGGGFGRNIRVHHNLAWDCHWNGAGVTGAWKSNADLYNIAVYNNTFWQNGHYTDNPRFNWRENLGPAGGIVVSFPAKSAWAGRDQPRRPLKGRIEDILVANNLILDPRDYALALKNEGDPEASRIVFTHNLTDLKQPSSLLNTDRNASWNSARDDSLIVVDDPILRSPQTYDFRLRPGTPANDGGLRIDIDGIYQAIGGATYIGAFGPDSKWVEVSEPN